MPSSSSSTRVSRQFVLIVLVALVVYSQVILRVLEPLSSSPLLSSLPSIPVPIASSPAFNKNATTSTGTSIHNVTATATATTSASASASGLSICFVASTYGQWAVHADRLQNVRILDFYNRNSIHFVVFTNLPHLVAPGWHKLIRRFDNDNDTYTYRRYITQSRHAKFWAWNDTYIQDHCQVVLYMDSIGHVLNGNDTLAHIQETARAIYQSPQGHAQYLHKGGGGAFGEFRRIEVFHKDVMENIQASKEWLIAQGVDRHRQHNCTLYENRYIGYAVGRPTTFSHAAADCLWPRYSLELDSWRDQPLWCYCLDHFNITPIPLPHTQIWKLQPKRMGKHGHKYKTEKEANVK